MRHDRLQHLGGGLRLLGGGGGDLAHELARARDRLDDVPQRRARLVREQRCPSWPPPRRRGPPPPRRSVSCWTCRTTSPISLAASTERSASLRTSSATTAKPRPASPGAGGLDGGVQREEVGLVRDLLDDLEDACRSPASACPRPVMTRAVFSMFSEMAFMPSTVRATASPPVLASSEARALMRSASEAILATSLTAPAISETVAAGAARRRRRAPRRSGPPRR